MKKKELQTVLNALRPIKMPLIENKPFRNSLISDHFTLLKAMKKYQADIEDLERVHLGAFEDERRLVGSLQQKLRMTSDKAEAQRLTAEIDSHTELFAAIKAYNDAVKALSEEEVEIIGVDREKFVEEIQKQDFSLGLMEDLYPLFT